MFGGHSDVQILLLGLSMLRDQSVEDWRTIWDACKANTLSTIFWLDPYVLILILKANGKVSYRSYEVSSCHEPLFTTHNDALFSKIGGKKN